MRLPLSLLARLRFLRGTWLDPFGHTHERRTERALIDEYRFRVEALLATLDARSLEHALAVARVPDTIRGFGHVKEASVREARAQWDRLEHTAVAAAKSSAA
jgi:indolepyruvate ferredoxin oxidoreductase